MSTKRSSAVKPVRAGQPKRSDSVVPLAATLAAPGTEEGVREDVGVVEDEVNFEELAKELENASPLEIMDRALAKFGNDIAIAFRCLMNSASFLFF